MTIAVPFHVAGQCGRHQRPNSGTKRIARPSLPAIFPQRRWGECSKGDSSPDIPAWVVFQINLTPFGGPNWAGFSPISLPLFVQSLGGAKKLYAVNLR